MIAGFASKALNALPAVRPVTSATTPSRLFQTIVKYSSLEPRRAIVARSRDSVPSISIGYSAKGVEGRGSMLYGSKEISVESACDLPFTNRIHQIRVSSPALASAHGLALCFHRAETLFIASIDFFFQSFANRTEKNNQLDTPLRTQ